MPIMRWRGWGAQCRACGQWVDLGDGCYAWESRDHVKESLCLEDGDTQEQAITAACVGCQQRRTAVMDAALAKKKEQG